jgi:hypothetical protein
MPAGRRAETAARRAGQEDAGRRASPKYRECPAYLLDFFFFAGGEAGFSSADAGAFLQGPV